MADFDHILNWELKAGSHEFPGPQGGTCINESAIVAAGFEYNAVRSPDDCPPCFSRPLSAYALQLNDAMSDDLRQELLMPFVTRLAGSADTPQVEQKRAQLIALATINRILPVVLDARGFTAQAQACREARTLEAARAAAQQARVYAPAASAAYAAYADAAYADAAAYAAYAADAAYADAAAYAA